MIKKILSASILSMLILNSCDEKNNISKDTISLEITSIKKINDLYSRISSYEFIKLKTDSSNRLGTVDKIVFYNDTIYIADRRKSKSVFVYSKNGQFISSVSNIGQGPGEYIQISDFNIDKLTNELYILDAELRKILIYDNKCKFLREIKLDFIAVSFIITEDKLIFDKFNMIEWNKTDDYNYNLLICDKKGKILKGYLPINKDLSGYNMGPLSGLWQNSISIISYLPPISNQLYSYNLAEDKLAKRINLDFGNNWPDEYFYKKNKTIHPAEVIKLIIGENLSFCLNCSENNEFLCIGFYLGNEKIIGFISKKNNKYELFYANDAIFELLPLTIDEKGNFINVIYPELIIDYKPKNMVIPEEILTNKSDIVLFRYSLKAL
jgi:hypothetical protein